jgi:serine/threonine-protein kinase HipA
LILTIQIHDTEKGWLDAAELTRLSDKEFKIEYDTEYACSYWDRRDCYSLSLRFPVQLDSLRGSMPPFLVDLIPQGNFLLRLLRRYKITSDSDYWAILSQIPLASPGNIRIREPWIAIEKERSSYSHKGFLRHELVSNGQNFLEYMEQHGAPIGGTSGAAGGAPKFLLREDYEGRLHADGYLDDSLTKVAWLIKLPFTDSNNSILLSQTEKSYYDVLRSLPLRTSHEIDIETNILFIKRFDRMRMPDNCLHYLGMESFYSAHGIGEFGAYLNHEDNLRLIDQHSTNPEQDIVEYVKRDIVYNALSNTDNHGRNSSFLKADNLVGLSPIYDVTAMRFFEGDHIVPLTRWSSENSKLKARIKWIEENVACDADVLHRELVQLRECLKDLESLLIKHQVDKTIVDRSAGDREWVKKELGAV